mmetsp:Transcript_16676/g.31561  ORF Transcript_16676/g.31561 Transcript_16676/m.31561 type:complete len:208 (+) Transcript_16676:282-905(+)
MTSAGWLPSCSRQGPADSAKAATAGRLSLAVPPGAGSAALSRGTGGSFTRVSATPPEFAPRRGGTGGAFTRVPKPGWAAIAGPSCASDRVCSAGGGLRLGIGGCPGGRNVGGATSDAGCRGGCFTMAGFETDPLFWLGWLTDAPEIASDGPAIPGSSSPVGHHRSKLDEMVRTRRSALCLSAAAARRSAAAAERSAARSDQSAESFA